MTKQEGKILFEDMHPGFFEKEDIKKMPEKWVCDELIMKLDEFDESKYSKKLADNVTFGIYEGDLEELKSYVRRVVEYWADIYENCKNEKFYCGYVDGKIASFCIIENMGEHTVNGQTYKIGGPGCVGTLPEYRNMGIGLTMIMNATKILKDEGYDYSYIHFTGEAKWYQKAGYEPLVQWNKHGIIEE